MFELTHGPRAKDAQGHISDVFGGDRHEEAARPRRRRITDSLSRADFAFEDLRTARATIFLVLPRERLGTHARWLRLLAAQALHSLARGPARAAPTAIPILFLLDELAARGRLEPLAQAYGLMAGYGVQLWAILQDLYQLKSLYGERHGTFLANAAVTQVFNVADFDAAHGVSRTLGVTTETFKARAGANSASTAISSPPTRSCGSPTT